MRIENLSAVRPNLFTGVTYRGKAAGSGLFSDALKDASQTEKTDFDKLHVSSQNGNDLSGITESGRNSAGTNKLTDLQKQYLRDKYDMDGLSESQFDFLLAEMTNMGALSYQDYGLSHLRVASINENGCVSATAHKVSDGWLDPIAGSKNFAAYYRQLNREDKEDAEFAEENWGAEPSDRANECNAAHQRIGELLDSLTEQK